MVDDKDWGWCVVCTVGRSVCDEVADGPTIIGFLKGDGELAVVSNEDGAWWYVLCTVCGGSKALPLEEKCHLPNIFEMVMVHHSPVVAVHVPVVAVHVDWPMMAVNVDFASWFLVLAVLSSIYQRMVVNYHFCCWTQVLQVVALSPSPFMPFQVVKC